MPDLQSELAKLASAWDTHEQIIRSPQNQTTPEKTMTATAPTTITKTGNLSRDLFNYTKQGAYTRQQVTAAMESVGYVRKSAQSIITQLVRSSMVCERDGRLYPLQAEYAPIKNPTKPSPTRSYTRRQLKPAKPAKQTKAAGLAALNETKPEPAQEAKPVRLVRLQSATEVLANMSVVEAHKLYVELGKIFGAK